MNPTQSTLKFVGVAAVSLVLAYGSWLGTQPSDIDGFSEVGQQFFPDFDDVSAATALTVTDFNSEDKDVQTFSVKQNDDGLWVIPSHHDYPAEAEDRLAKSATSILGVKKIAVKSRSKDDWKRFGVIDPADDGAATAEERGQRLTLSDGSGNPLVDLIIGTEVEGQENQYHVREPEKNTTYIAELDVDLSAKFSDWIEPDLLKIDSATDITKLTLDNYSIDETRGVVKKTELLDFQKEDLKTSGDWKLEGLDEEKEELDDSPVRSIATNLNDLKIVGVRPKPEGLDGNLRVNPVVKQILQQQMQSLGYFIGGDKDGNERLYSNEGELIAGTDDGVEYTLYFGEIARGSGKDIEVGAATSETKPEGKDDEEEGDKKAEEESEEEDGPRRYLLIKVGFNEGLLGEKPVAPEEPVKPEILKEEADKGEESGEEEPAKSEEKKEEQGDKKDAAAAEKEETSKEEEQTPTNIETPDEKAEEAKEEPKPGKAATEEKAEEAKPAKEEKAKAEPAKEKAKAEPAEAAKEEKAETEKPSTEKPADKSEEKSEEAAEKKEEKEAEPAPDPKEVAQKEYDAAVKKYEADKKTFESDLSKYEDRVKEGKEKVDELALRFDAWYYVISSDSFDKFRVTRKDVIKEKSDEEEEKAEDDKK